jgi:hypothetical protein
MIWGQGWPPHGAIQKFSIDDEIMLPMLKQVMILLMGIFGQAGAGLCERACCTDSAFKQLIAVGQQWVAN